jgi:hypothetical protein
MTTDYKQAGGNLGPTILKAFLDSPSFNTSVLSRESSSATFPSNVNVIRANYDSPDALKKAFEGQDVVISLLASTMTGDQNKFIDAAIAAGVQRFIPSEFGSNTKDAQTRAIVPAFEAKFGTVNYLKSKEKEISWTSIIPGPFFDWGLMVGFLGFSFSDKSATLFDDGTATFSATNLRTIGLTVVKALENPEATKNQYVFVSGFQTTQKEILQVAEKITGDKWTVTNVSTKDLIKEAGEKIQKGDYSGIYDQIKASGFGADELCDLTPEGLWNEKLGLPKGDFEKSVRAGFEGKLGQEW